MTELTDKVALVTGAGAGVGRALSLMLADAGAVVGLLSRRAEPLLELEHQIQQRGGRAVALPADVGDEQGVEVAIGRLAEAVGGIDLLIHSAGVGLYGPVETYRFDDWQQTLATNVTGLFLCARGILPFLKQRGGGHIVAISSGAGRRGYANLAAYSASKFAVIGFMESLAEEVGGDGIKCTTVLPGSILTDFGPGTREAKQASDKKYLLPEDVARSILQVLQQPDHVWTQQVNLWPF